MPATANVPLSGDADINGLLSGVKWAVFQLTYSFPASGSFYGGFSYSPDREHLNDFEALNSVQQTGARTALGLYASYTALTFSEVTESASIHGDLRLAESDDPSTAWAYFPSSAARGGDVWINNSSNDYDAPFKGSYAYHTFLHELGHSLGLEHGHDASDGYAMTAAHDSMEYSVMTYRSYEGQAVNGYTNETWGFAQTPMMYDIAALQVMYGANYAANAGDTTYSWNPGTGEFSINGVGQGAPGGNRVFMTVWDGGGSDTYDFSNYTTAVQADLRPGSWTTMSQGQRAYLGDGNYAEGNVANALLFGSDVRSLIENVTGGAGNDTLTGNEAGNRIWGGGGNDTLLGGLGLDTARYAGARSSYAVAKIGLTTTIVGPEGADTLTGIEQLQFSDATLTLGAAAHFDANADGKSDILWRNTNGDVVSWQMHGGGLWDQPADTPVPLSSSLIDAHGDYNGDGTSDILWRNANGSVLTWEMKGGALRDTSPSIPVPLSWSVIDAHGDYNGDGKSDILWRITNGTVVTWEMKGGGLWDQWADIPVPLIWSVIDAHGDYNGDGKSDILWRDTNGTVVTWEMKGGGLWDQSADIPVPLSWSVIDAHGDYNGDGKSDILWRNANGDVVTWEMKGGGLWDQSANIPVLLSWSVIDAHGDYNGDGKSDILWRNANGDVVTWQMKGGGLWDQSANIPVPLNWSVIDAHGDYNGDGKSDILWRNANGDVVTWEMKGGGLWDQSASIPVLSSWNIMDAVEKGATLRDGAGDGTLTGTVGRDTLIALQGNDTLAGGAGADRFFFDTALNASTNRDTVLDFKPGTDTLLLSDLIFTKFSPGIISTDNFRSGSGATALDANDYILYNTSTGVVSYDSDGSGAAAATAFALLQGAPVLTAQDIVVGIV